MMNTENVRPIDAETLNIFASKGTQGGESIQQTGNANGVKVRRIMQITKDLSRKPFSDLKILDLACGEGVYSIEAGLRGAMVTGVDARTTRMNDGANAAKRLGLANVVFQQKDIRQLSPAVLGTFDAVYFLGILYHLDAADIVPMMRSLYALTDHMVIIDTHISHTAGEEFINDTITLQGRRIWEHNETDPDEVRHSRPLASIDNPFSFYLTRESLFRTLAHVGFTSVLECHAPLEPGKPLDRVSIVAFKNQPVRLSTYTWVNDKAENDITAFLGISQTPAPISKPSARVCTAPRLVNRVLQKFGLEIRRIGSKA